MIPNVNKVILKKMGTRHPVAEGFWLGGLLEITAGLVINTCVH